MQVTTPTAYVKFGVVTALIGAIAGCAVSLATPKRYVSTAVLASARPLNSSAARNFRQKQQQVLSRSSLSELIQQPKIDLYREDRRRYPMEDILQAMRDRDLKIESGPGGVRVTFEYDDPVKAQAVVREVSSRLGDSELEVVTPASLPEGPVRPRWRRLIGTGLAAGLGAGLLLAFLRGRTVRWALKMIGGTVAGAMAAIAICLLLPDTILDEGRVYELVGLGAACGLTLGAWLLRERAGSSGYGRQIAVCAVACALLGAFASYVVAERYVSNATLRMYAVPPGAASPAERLRVLTEDTLSRGSLAELVQRPALDLYRGARQRYPMEDILEAMRADIKIEAASGAGPAVAGPEATFRISFRYADRFKAQAVVRELTTKYMEGNFLMERKLHPDAAGLAAEIIDPASLPVESVSPNRTLYIGVGMAFGALLGALLGWRRWRAENPPTEGLRPSYLRYALLTAAAGVVIAALVSFAIPERYASSAVLRVTVPAGQDAASRAQEMIAQVMTRDALAEIIQSPALYL